MNEHLNSDQIDELLRSVADSTPSQVANRDHLEEARRHLKDCTTCQTRMRAHEQAIESLALLKPKTPGAKGLTCPPDYVWLDIAAGILDKDAENDLRHAAQCDHCGSLLQQAKEDFAEELSSEESAYVAGLRSAKTDWQRSTAAQLIKGAGQEIGVPKPTRRSARGPSRLLSVAWFQGLALASAIAVVALASFWLRSYHPRAVADPNQLLASAYSEERSVQMRFEGVGYAPLRQQRGNRGQDRMRRPALLKAEAEISERLKADPEAISWLQASGRASLLEGDPQSAIEVLQKANRLDNNNLSVCIDLASAYILRGQIQKQPDDFGQAVQILGPVLIKEPHNEVAQFNDAVAKEGSPIFREGAIKAWELFLKEHSDSPWAPEARTHLQALQQITHLRKQRNDGPLMTPEQLSLAFAIRQEQQINEIDARIEEYQELAVQQWLPGLFASTSASPQNIQNLDRALSGLGILLEERHHDRWLHDFLNFDRKSPQLRQAVQLMSESERLVQSSEDNRALWAATQASSIFERAGVHAGLARAQFTIILVNQLLHRSRECAAEASQLASTASSQGFAWLTIQGELEIGNCASMDDAFALRMTRNALDSAQAHGYHTLELRADNTLSGVYRTLGDTHSAWAAIADGMRAYWDRSSPSLRGYNLLDNLDEIAQEQHQWFLAAAILDESIPMIANNPDLAMRAFEQARLGQALLKGGDIDNAEKNFRESQRLFAAVPSGGRREMLSAEAELGLAKAEITRGDAPTAVKHLEGIRAIVSSSTEDDLRLDYFETLGIALMHSGEPVRAEATLDAALDLTEKGLRLVSSKDDRLKWSQHNETAYRAMVELKLLSNPEQALAYWEWYRGAALRRSVDSHQAKGTEPTLQKLASGIGSGHWELGNDISLVSYMVFPGGVAAWVSNDHGITERWIDVPESDLESLVHRFVERCADPESNVETLRRDGAELYREILAPLEPSLGRSQLIIEPDRVLRLVPFSAVVDGHGNYLVDRHAITISPGLNYLSVSRPWRKISPESQALVVGDPAVSGWTSLPDAEREARSVAARFHHPYLLLGVDINHNTLASDMRRSDIVHFSGHATAGATSAGLVMDDLGLFDATRLQAMTQQQNRLVVLSACETARGTTGMYDDPDSLVRGLLNAGIPEVVASRWIVDSTATAALMSRFYDRLFEAMSVSQSLGLATQDLRKQPRFSHPFYWAGFSTFGAG